MSLNRFQIEVATGRFTLPVVILVCLLLWGVSMHQWSDLISFGITAFIGYLMIEANTAFTLIRTRTALPVCFYWYLASSLCFIHPFEWSHFAPLAFMLSIFNLFLSYESPSATTSIYHSFLFIGLGSWCFPQIVFFTPLLFICMFPLRSLSIKTFFAAILGLLTPYWFLFGYAFYFDRIPLFYEPLQELFHFCPMDYSQLSFPEIVSWIGCTLFLIIFGIHYSYISYLDKIRTRIYHSFLIYSSKATALLGTLQPQHLPILLPIQLIFLSFLGGHLFTLTRNRFSGILFIVTFLMMILLTLYNVWMQYFNS